MAKWPSIEPLLKPVAGRDLMQAIIAVGLVDPFKGTVENPPAESRAMVFQSALALGGSPAARRAGVGFGAERQIEVRGRSLHHGP
jgi:hypothetical protein